MKKAILILVIPIAAACGAKQQQATPTPVATVASAPSLPPGHPVVDAKTPPPAPAQSPNVLSGKIVETMNAGGYTYIRIGDKWAAVPATKVKKGATVTIGVQMVAENFESKTLNRKFDKIIFGAIENAPARVQQQPLTMTSAMGTPAQHMNPSVDAAPIKVEKAANGKTVAEVWEKKSVMKDQPVTIRGQVVKFLPEIMGKNWLHLRDGSGTRAKGDDDITVTTKDNVKVGDVITVSGTLRVDKDFGAGYMYPVIVEDAKVSQ